MDVTILGCGAAFPRAGGACSGYLVRGEQANVWLDAGNGTFSRLQNEVSYRDLDAVVLSHAHPDHIADMIPFMYALGFDDEVSEPVPVYAPADVPRALRSLLGEGSTEIFDRVFSFAELDGAFEVGDVRFEPFRTVHPVETYGFRVSDDGRSFVYTADTADFPELPDACRDARLLACEATFVRGDEGSHDIHLWADEAGRVAAKAGAAELILVHVWGTTPLETAVEQAAESYDGPLEGAVEGKTYRL